MEELNELDSTCGVSDDEAMMSSQDALLKQSE